MRWVGDPDVALVVYFVIVLPGVVIHELCHWLMAKVLGVRVRRFSLGPVRKGRSKRVSLGSIQVGNVDPVRASLIGLAPLLGGSAVILLIGNQVLGMGELAEALAGPDLPQILAGLDQLVRVSDFWLWLYLIFAVSNAMLPSDSDVAVMRPVLIFLGIASLIFLVVGGIPTVSEEVVNGLNATAGYLASAFGLTLVADAVFVLIIAALTWVTRRAQGD
jgi:hypothetical protein